MVAGSILDNSVYLFKLEESGSGFKVRQYSPLIVSSHSSFRAVGCEGRPRWSDLHRRLVQPDHRALPGVAAPSRSRSRARSHLADHCDRPVVAAQACR